MMVDAERRGREVRGKGARGQQQRRMLVLEQAEISRLGLQTPQQTRLVDDVDVQLQPIGNAAIPHRHGEQVSVRRDETIRYLDALVPCLPLLGVLIAVADDVHLGGNLVPIKLGKLFFPESKRIDLEPGSARG
jgi:hypothetical protein